MGKSLVSKAASAKNKRLGVAKSKSTTVGKKIVKKRVEIDLEQPKDRDPIDPNTWEAKRIADEQEVQRMTAEIDAERLAAQEARRSEHYQKLVPNFLEWWMRKFYSDAVNQAVARMDKINSGNSLFAIWEDRHSGSWSQPSLRYDALFNDIIGTSSSCEDCYLRIYNSVISDNSQLAQYHISAFDEVNIADNHPEKIWTLRHLAIRSSLQNSFSFFAIDEFADNPDNNHFSAGDRAKPRLQLDSPLVGFWLICSEMFDYPWTATFDDDYYNDPSSRIVLAIKQKHQANSTPIFRSLKEKSLSPELTKIIDPIYPKEKLLSPKLPKIIDPMYEFEGTEIEEQVMGKQVVNRSTKPKSDNNRFGPLQDDDYDADENFSGESADVDNSMNYRKAPTVTRQGHSSNRFASLQSDDDSTAASETQAMDEVKVLGVRKNPRKPPESSDEEDDDDNEEVGNNAGSLANALEEDEDDARHGNGDRNADDADLEGNNTTAFRVHNTPAQDYRNWISKNSSAAPSPHVQRPMTIAEKISNLIQVNMEGVPGKCHIFETTFPTVYQGSNSGTLAEAILSSTVLNSLEEGINNSPHNLNILPISDSSYNQQNLRIRTSADLRTRMSIYRTLSTYCDRDNPYAATNSKPGEKKLRTRIRVGFALADGSAKSPSLASRGASRSTAGP